MKFNIHKLLSSFLKKLVNPKTIHEKLLKSKDPYSLNNELIFFVVVHDFVFTDVHQNDIVELQLGRNSLNFFP